MSSTNLTETILKVLSLHDDYEIVANTEEATKALVALRVSLRLEMDRKEADSSSPRWQEKPKPFDSITPVMEDKLGTSDGLEISHRFTRVLNELAVITNDLHKVYRATIELEQTASANLSRLGTLADLERDYKAILEEIEALRKPSEPIPVHIPGWKMSSEESVSVSAAAPSWLPMVLDFLLGYNPRVK